MSTKPETLSLPPRVALFGGSFDPPHLGHLLFTLSLQELVGFDQVLWIPNAQNPLKERILTPFQDRLKMIHMAIKPISTFSVLDWEGKRPPPSYTIDTVRRLVELYGNSTEFSLLLGADQLYSLHLWREREELFSLAPPTIGARGGVNLDWKTLPLKTSLKDDLRRKFHSIPQFEVSSTTIRDRMKRGDYCGHLLPAPVLDYMRERHLYYPSSKASHGEKYSPSASSPSHLR